MSNAILSSAFSPENAPGILQFLTSNQPLPMRACCKCFGLKLGGHGGVLHNLALALSGKPSIFNRSVALMLFHETAKSAAWRTVYMLWGIENLSPGSNGIAKKAASLYEYLWRT